MSQVKRTKVPLAVANDSNTYSARTDTDAAINAGEAIAALKLAGQPHRIEGGRPYRITEEGKVESLERYMLHPVMRRGEVLVYDGQSFTEYFNRFKDTTSVVFADKIGLQFTGIIDYHDDASGERAGWGRHRVVLQLRQTLAWTTWAKGSGTPMNQTMFAQFLEDNIPDIAEPAGAQIVEIARSLEARKNVVFESNIARQSDGSVRLIYSEDVQGTASRGQIPIPSAFKLVLRPFEGSDPYSIMARFRYRVAEGGKLSMWFDLVRTQDVLEDAFAKELERIDNGVEDPVNVYNGPAPARLTSE